MTMISPVLVTRLVSVVGLVLSSLLLVPVLITQARGGDVSTIPFLAYLQVGLRVLFTVVFNSTISHYHKWAIKHAASN